MLYLEHHSSTKGQTHVKWNATKKILTHRLKALKIDYK